VPDTKPKSRRKIAAQTAEPLKPAAPIEKSKAASAPVRDDDAIQKLLGVLYALAIEGNTTAAKLYLDFCAKQVSNDPTGLSADDALKILQEQTT
jgi:hypothetical protein